MIRRAWCRQRFKNKTKWAFNRQDTIHKEQDDLRAVINEMQMLLIPIAYYMRKEHPNKEIFVIRAAYVV